MEQYELLSQLEKIAEITFKIQIIYSKLTLLEVSKDITHDYDIQKKSLLDALSILLEEEQEAYLPLQEEYDYIDQALELFNKNIDVNASEKIILIQERIIRNLERLQFKVGIEDHNEDLLESFLEQDFFATLFFDRDYDLDDLEPIINHLVPTIQESFSRHYIGSLNEEIKNPSNFDYRRLFINKKLDYIFTESGLVEQENLREFFNYNSKMALDKELEIPNVSKDIKESYISHYAMDRLQDFLIICGACSDIDIAIEEIVWIKTYLLFLNESDLEKFTKAIETYNFQNYEIKNLLLKTIKDLPIIKKIHNKDSKSYQK